MGNVCACCVFFCALVEVGSERIVARRDTPSHENRTMRGDMQVKRRVSRVDSAWECPSFLGKLGEPVEEYQLCDGSHRTAGSVSIPN